MLCRYELLCGETPFNKGSPKATMALIAETSKDPYFPSHLSAAAVDIIKRLLTRDQAARLVQQRLPLQPLTSHVCVGIRPRRRCRHQDPPIFQSNRLECAVQGQGAPGCSACVRSLSRACVQVSSPVKLEDLSTDMPISASSKAKAKQAVQSRAFQVPVCARCRVRLAAAVICNTVLLPRIQAVPAHTPRQVTQSVAEVFQGFDFLGSRAGKPQGGHEI